MGTVQIVFRTPAYRCSQHCLALKSHTTYVRDGSQLWPYKHRRDTARDGQNDALTGSQGPVETAVTCGTNHGVIPGWYRFITGYRWSGHGRLPQPRSSRALATKSRRRHNATERQQLFACYGWQPCSPCPPDREPAPPSPPPPRDYLFITALFAVLLASTAPMLRSAFHVAATVVVYGPQLITL